MFPSKGTTPWFNNVRRAAFPNSDGGAKKSLDRDSALITERRSTEFAA
jgi:hypothetical protein